LAKLIRKRRGSPPGAPPGTLTVSPDAVSPRLRALAYGKDRFEEVEGPDLERIKALREAHAVLWVDVTGLADVDLIGRLGEMFGLNPLALEDVVNVHQRPKAEEFPDHIFAVVRMVRTGIGADTEQLSLFFGADYVLSFQERPGDCFDPVRERLRRDRGRLRQQGPDYLAYTLIDAVIDGYFPVLERYGEEIEELEDAVIATPDRRQVERLHHIKRDLLLLRRAMWPMREMINMLIRDESPFVTAQTRLFLRDAYDHSIQLMDIVEAYREISTGLTDVYLSSMSTKLNEVMKLLTVIATIFIPLTFLAGVWGMNFAFMPELGWRYGYPAALLLMFVVAAALVWYFWRKGWLTNAAPSKKD
jgi:magnesium transporter